MKYLSYVLLLAIGIQSCKSKTSNYSTNTTHISKSINQNNTLIEKFKPIIQGVWVKKDYIEKVIKTKSPAAAESLTDGITILNIDTRKIAGDSLKVSAGYGNHEGGELMLKFRAGKQPGTISIYDASGQELAYELSYQIIGRDTILSLYKTQKSTTTVIKYIKALNDEPVENLGLGMDYLINKGIIAGKYTWMDNTVLKDIIFTNDGKVIGMPDYKTYGISNDIGGEPMNNLDGITFNLYTKNQHGFTYIIHADTLKIYDRHANTDSTEDVIGEMRYLLVRKK